MSSSSNTEQTEAMGEAGSLHQDVHFSWMAALLKNGTYSDLLIRCGEEVYNVHKSIVCPRAGFFAAACENSWKEGQNCEIVLPDEEREAAGRMLQYLYTSHYDGCDPDPTDVCYARHQGLIDEYIREDDIQKHDETPAKLMANAEVYSIAHKYDIPELMTLAKSKFTGLMHCLEDPDDLPAVARVVFESTHTQANDLRDIIWAFCGKFPSRIVDDDDWLAVIDEYPAILVGITREAVRIHQQDLWDLMDEWEGNREYEELELEWVMTPVCRPSCPSWDPVPIPGGDW